MCRCVAREKPPPPLKQLLCNVLFACTLAPLGGLVCLGTSVIPLLVVLELFTPITLVLECGFVRVEVPGGVAHVLRNVWVDVFARLLIHCCWGNTSFSSFIQLLLPPKVFMVFEECVC